MSDQVTIVYAMDCNHFDTHHKYYGVVDVKVTIEPLVFIRIT